MPSTRSGNDNVVWNTFVRWALLAFLAVAAGGFVQLANRNVYSKTEVDYRDEVLRQRMETQYLSLKEQLNRMQAQQDRMLGLLQKEDSRGN